MKNIDSRKVQRSAAVAIVACFVVAGCAPVAPRVDSEFGRAVREARAAQAINPTHINRSDPVLGIDGGAGIAAQERYLDGFRNPGKTSDSSTSTRATGN